MQLDDLLIWLVTAMGLTAVFFLLWTLAALVRRSGPRALAMEGESGRQLSGLTPGDRGHA